jgi:FkbM family methyltransferase
LFQVLNNAAEALHLGYENFSYEFDVNGEANVLRALVDQGMAVIFDVGANVGAWLLAARKVFPQAEIHAFEIAPPTFAKLRQRIDGSTGAVTLNMVGLAAIDGRMTLNYVEQADGLSSGVAVIGSFPSASIEVEVVTGDSYCRQRNIDRIDFLKLDVEGMEEAVLTGFSQMLAAGKIRVIQFEYGMVNIASRVLLKDFYEMLGAYGYAVGKIYPLAVEFREYDWRQEDFRGPNFLAVHESEPELLTLVATPTR